MKRLVSYQREVDKGKLTAVASLGKLTFRARALRRSKELRRKIAIYLSWSIKAYTCCRMV